MGSDIRADILIVDDVPENLRLLGDLLSKEGYKVRLAPSGKLALRAAENQAPDLIMLDISMPEMDGFEVCQRLKKNQSLQSIPVIFISALTETLDKVKAFDVGGVDYVTKPFEEKEVLSRIKAHCELRRTQQELSSKNEALEETLTELKTAQLQLVQSEKMASLGVLTAGIAHEINNPVNFVCSGTRGMKKLIDNFGAVVDQCASQNDTTIASETFSKPFTDNSEHCKEFIVGIKELMLTIEAGADRVADIVKGLRIFSRLDEDDKKLINVNENIDSALMLLRNRTEDRIAVNKQYGEDSMLLCYPGKINQVFLNMFSNAIDAIEASVVTVDKTPGSQIGIITIYTSVVERDEQVWFKFTVSDTGNGIPTEVQDHLYEPFYTTKEVGKGIGLGLAISHGIVNEHGGRIEFDTVSGKGTSFTIWLPKA